MRRYYEVLTSEIIQKEATAASADEEAKEAAAGREERQTERRRRPIASTTPQKSIYILGSWRRRSTSTNLFATTCRDSGLILYIYRRNGSSIFFEVRWTYNTTNIHLVHFTLWDIRKDVEVVEFVESLLLWSRKFSLLLIWREKFYISSSDTNLQKTITNSQMQTFSRSVRISFLHILEMARALFLYQ